MTTHTCIVLAGLALAAILPVHAHAPPDACNVRVKTDAGLVCGLPRRADDGSVYASFRGVPYAKQPVGELRFKELEPLEPWDGYYYAINEGPICFQKTILYGRIMQPRGMSEACIHANIHVPIEALPKVDWRPTRELEPPIQTADESEEASPPGGLPILVFIHGGGFAFGSGDTDLHGPEYLVSKKVIVITFNYRLNVFGFLSLNTSKMPGNAGLRDMVTLLRWVQKNARAFGGDPDNVTLAGQSAGAIAAHLLTMSNATKGLIRRTILMSGTAISSFYSPSPYFAQYLQKQLLALLPINATDPDEIYKQLISLPAEKLCEANGILLDQVGFTTFVPTVEISYPGVTTIVDDYPDVLLAKGRGKDIPLLVGYTNSECETFRGRLEEFDFVQKSKDNRGIVIPPKTLFTTLRSSWPDIAKKMERKYYNGTISSNGFVRACNDGFYEYPVLKLMEAREKSLEAPLYVYKFSYEGENSVLKEALGLRFHGAGHIEDLTYIFKVNSIIRLQNSFPPKNDDDQMKLFMTNFFVNFMSCGKPICNQAEVETEALWPATSRDLYLYEDIQTPNVYQVKSISAKQQDIIKFFDTLNIVE